MSRMDSIDATNRVDPTSNAPPPSLLIVILDTSPSSWAHLHASLPLSSVVKALVIFLNAHLALNHANRVAVLASHISSAHWLYPSPVTSSSSQANEVIEAEQQAGASKYRQFSVIEHQIRKNLDSILRNTSSDAQLSAAPLLSTAISTALTYVNIQTLLSAPAVTNDASNAGDLPEAGLGDLDQYTSAARSTLAGPQLVSRILVFSVSTADTSGQYISLMNGVFAAQRLNVPIDMLRIGARHDSTAFLQQASDVTHGIFLHYDPFESGNGVVTTNGTTNGSSKTNGNDHERTNNKDAQVMGLLQTLLMAYLPDLTARRHLVPAGSAEVDFRAACFCHGKVVSSGGVCSVCLSIFCIPLDPEITHCPTCNSRLKVPKSMSIKPAVIPKKKKKRKKTIGESNSATATPNNGTPLR